MVNNSGPLIGVRVLDLSRVLAELLGVDEAGVSGLESRGVVARGGGGRA